MSAFSGSGAAAAVFVPPPIEGIAPAQARADAWRTQLADAATQAQRDASRMAFTDQSAATAVSTDQSAFAALTAPAITGPPLATGERIENYLDDQTAQISTSDGHGAVVSSTLPLLGTSPTGRHVPVDLSLQPAAGGFTPLSSAARVVLPDAADGEATFVDRGFGVRLAGAAAQSATVSHDRVFFGDAFGRGADVDAILEPVQTGLEVLYVLRSASSPEDQTLHFDLPPGARLVLQGSATDPQWVAIEDSSGGKLGLVAPPGAVDAAGAPVTVTYSLGTAATDLVVHVAHRDANLEYPILVDPLVGYWTDLAHSTGWSWGTNSSGTMSPQWDGPFIGTLGPCCVGQGANGQWGEWTFNSVANSYIYELYNWNVWHWPNNSQEFGGLYSTYFGWYETGSWADSVISGTGGFGPGGSCGNPNTCYAVRLQSSQEQYVTTDYCARGATNGSQGGCPRPQTGGTGFPPNNIAVVAGLNLTGATASGYRADAEVQGAYLYQADDYLPSAPSWSISCSPSCSGNSWLGRTTATISASSSDTGGLGMYSLELGYIPPGTTDPTALGTQLGSTVSASCNYQPGTAPCPPSLSGPISFSSTITSLPQGMDQFRVRAQDAPLNKWKSDFYMGVDKTAPSFTLSGSLYSARNSTINEGRYDLTIGSSDGTASNPQSGVKIVTVKVDGQQVDSYSPCPFAPPPGPSLPNCFGGANTWSMDAGDYGMGKHTITVTAGDWALPQNSFSQSFDVTVHRSDEAQLGPGQVNLNSGELTLASTDVSVPGPTGALTVQRAYLSRHRPGAGPLGPDWTLAIPASAAAAFRTLQPSPAGSATPTSVTLTDVSGAMNTFVATGATYTSPAGLQSWTLAGPLTITSGLPAACLNRGSVYQLTDGSGDVITFAAPNGSTTFAPCADTQPGGVNQNSYTFTSVSGILQPTQELAPLPRGVSGCPVDVTQWTNAANAGCRALTFVYASATATRTDCPTDQGDYLGRLTTVKFTASDPATSTIKTVDVVRYCYATSGTFVGRLLSEFDPRIAPALMTTYGYNASTGNIASLTPPGQQAWVFAFGSLPGESSPGRLVSVQRSDPGLSGTPTWNITYGVPVSGTGAPYAMDSASVARWAQTDLPGSATAIMPPDTNNSSDYTRGTVYYLDSFGRVVNVAGRGGRISTTEYDCTCSTTKDNVRRSLSAANRQAALADSNPPATAQLLDSDFTYSADGTELVDKVGPQHTVKLSSGSSVPARKHVHYTYDEGAPASGGPYRMATTVTTSAQISGQPDADPRTVHRYFSGQPTGGIGLGWILHKPTSLSRDPGGGAPAVVDTTLYDATTGMVTEQRKPGGAAGGDAHSAYTYYYTADAASPISACQNKPAFANLPCQVQRPQPGTPGLPALPVTTYSYNVWDEPTTTTTTAGSSTRTTTQTYDPAGRLKTSGVTGSVGTALPSLTYTYDTSIGGVRTVTDGARTITTLYDTLGRLQHYADADGATSDYTYDADGRLSASSDGKGSQAFFYDAVTGDLKTLQDTVGSTTLSFGATYDADGNLRTQAYPNGLTACYTYDATGQVTNLVYRKASDCSSGATWLADAVEPSIHDQWLSQTSTLSSQDYQYDGIGRLTQVKDTPATSVPAANRNEYAVPSASAGVAGITGGPDNALWFAESSANKLGRVATDGAFAEYAVPTAASKPQGIASGPDGALWFTENAGNKIGRATTSGTFTEYAAPSNNAAPYSIAAGSDGALWFTENGVGRIGRITTGGTATDYRIPTTKSNPTGIAAGPDNALWFTENGTSKIGRITTAGAFSEYATTTASSGPQAITAGSDGALWFTEASANKIGRITTAGAITEYPIPTSASSPQGITSGADGALWFVEAASGKLGRITTGGSITEYALPSATPGLAQIASGSDDALWFTEATSNKIGRAKSGTACTVRAYAYDADTNRTDLTTVPHPAFSGTCDTTLSDGTDQPSSYDAADRLTDSGVQYNAFGAITSLPAADAGGSTLSSSYYVDDTLYSQTQAGQTIQYNVDPLGRTREAVATGLSPSDAVTHFADPSDSPSWTVAGGVWTRYAAGIDGTLVAIETSAGTTLELSDLSGNIVGQASTDPAATGLLSTSESTEYGVPRGSNPAKYSWLGAGRRSTELPSGVVAMGARTYVPALGRFEQPDPVAGGSPNDYGYTFGDPVNDADPSGTVTVGLGDSSGYLADGTAWTPDLAAQWEAQWAAELADRQAAAAQSSTTGSVSLTGSFFESTGATSSKVKHFDRTVNLWGPVAVTAGAAVLAGGHLLDHAPLPHWLKAILSHAVERDEVKKLGADLVLDGKDVGIRGYVQVHCYGPRTGPIAVLTCDTEAFLFWWA